MKELELKLKELESSKRCCERCIENNKKEMARIKELLTVEAKEKNYADLFKTEQTLIQNLEAEKELERKINIINNAMDILEGVN